MPRKSCMEYNYLSSKDLRRTNHRPAYWIREQSLIWSPLLPERLCVFHHAPPFHPPPAADPLCLPMFSPVFTPPYVHPLPSKFLSPPSLPSAVYCPLFTPGFSWVYPLPSIVPFCHTDLRLKSFFPFGSNSCGYSRCALHNLPYGHSYGYSRALPPSPSR